MRRILLVLAVASAACTASKPEPYSVVKRERVYAPWLARPAPAPVASSTPTPSPVVPIAPSASASDETSTLGPLSGPIRAATFRNPMPGGIFAGYAGDTGLDLVGAPRMVHAIAAATVDYAEKGHTRWTGPKDSPYCVRLTLDEPIVYKGHKITHAYYAHLSGVAFEQPEGASKKRHVTAGEALGTSGVARGVPHLHLGLLLDGQVEQDDWAFILREGEVRAVLGGYSNGEVLPKG